MELERIKRKITALENKNQVNYASVSGTTYSITKNGTELSIDKDGYVVCNNTFLFSSSQVSIPPFSHFDKFSLKIYPDSGHTLSLDT